ncbi:MAG: ribbon-helix-helix domain-containing protein [Thaumarchaeota archaeon]|nr:ribbon-helix-helix domain-containing protein [Nitrososphaerota archaeon]MDG6908232.1 hypothetical protein [Nitrososphaerota archaeon]
MTEYNGAKGKKTTTRTIRIEEDVDEALVNLASKEKISVNFLVNSALRKYVEWDYLAIRFGIVTNFAGASRKMLSYLSDDQVKELARWVGRNQFKEFVNFWFKSINLANVLQSIRLLGYSGNFQYEEYTEGRTRTSVCKHNCGPKWSLYYEQVFRCIFEDVIKTQVNIESTDDQVLIKMPTTNEEFLETLYEDLQGRGQSKR